MLTGLEVDARLVVALAAIVLAGIAKGVTGMGMPIVGVPILVALYGDLRLVLVVTILATATTDIPMVWRYRDRIADARMLVGFLIVGAIGIVIGTRVLAIVPTAYLAAVLAAVVIAFVIVSWLGRVPTISRVLATRLGPLMGLVCGVLQGAAGAAGPITASYLLSVQLPRESFLFALNVIFLVLDWTQFFSLQQLGLTTLPRFALSVAIAVLVFGGLAIGLAIQRRIDDRAFRRGVLVMLALAAVGLVSRAARG